MGQKLSSKLLFIYSPNSDGFYVFHISQGSVRYDTIEEINVDSKAEYTA